MHAIAASDRRAALARLRAALVAYYTTWSPFCPPHLRRALRAASALCAGDAGEVAPEVGDCLALLVACARERRLDRHPLLQQPMQEALRHLPETELARVPRFGRGADPILAHRVRRVLWIWWLVLLSALLGTALVCLLPILCVVCAEVALLGGVEPLPWPFALAFQVGDAAIVGFSLGAYSFALLEGWRRGGTAGAHAGGALLCLLVFALALLRAAVAAALPALPVTEALWVVELLVGRALLLAVLHAAALPWCALWLAARNRAVGVAAALLRLPLSCCQRCGCARLAAEANRPHLCWLGPDAAP